MKILKKISLLNAVQALFFLNTGIWFILGVVTLVKMDNRDPGHTTMAMMMAILMFGNAAAMLWSGWAIGRQKMLYFYLAMMVLIVNLGLTVTDQFGFLDLITLGVDLMLLVLLVILRNRKKRSENAV